MAIYSTHIMVSFHNSFASCCLFWLVLRLSSCRQPGRLSSSFTSVLPPCHMAIYKFRSRYSEDDTSHLLVENRPREPSSLWWACLLCSARALCSSRIRVFISLVVLLAISAAGYNVSTILNFVDNQSSMQAHRQSFGYVDIPKWKWQSQKQYYKNKRANASPKSSALPTPDQVPAWYKSNLEVDFSCPEEHLVGDSWWICNPRQRGCTVYSTGPPIGLLTEKALAELLPSCEIHVFDPSNRTKPINDNSTTIQVHSWGFADTT